MKLIALESIDSSVGAIAKGQTFAMTDVEAARDLIAAGKASSIDVRPTWDGLHWPAATVVILASGPSLTVEQCAAVREWRDAAPTARRVIVINTTYQRAPWADVLYACDAPWWRLNVKQVRQVFTGELWTQDKTAMREFEVKRIESVNAVGLGRQPGVIHQGGNGGYQAINLAVQAGARRLVLLGFDMAGTHWHGRHPTGLANTSPALFEAWIRKFDPLAADLREDGIDVVNATTTTALACFRRAPLEQALMEGA